MLKTNAYAAARDQLLLQIVGKLTIDARFVAAWLTGSFSRGAVDEVSDLDLNVVTTDEGLLARPSLPPHQTTPERLALIQQFGEPGILFEAHQNAPPGGTFTTVFYADTAVCVDWILLPATITQRPLPSQLLFEKATIPIQPPPQPESLAERVRLAEKEVGYFWLMAAVMVKYIIRDEFLLFNSWLNILHDALYNAQRLVDGQPWHHQSGANITLKLTKEEQVIALRQICSEMLALMPQITTLGGQLPVTPMSIVEMRLALVQ